MEGGSERGQYDCNKPSPPKIWRRSPSLADTCAEEWQGGVSQQPRPPRKSKSRAPLAPMSSAADMAVLRAAREGDKLSFVYR